MNIKLNASGLFNILTIILVITLLCTVGACSPRNHIQVMQQQRRLSIRQHQSLMRSLAKPHIPILKFTMAYLQRVHQRSVRLTEQFGIKMRAAMQSVWR